MSKSYGPFRDMVTAKRILRLVNKGGLGRVVQCCSRPTSLTDNLHPWLVIWPANGTPPRASISAAFFGSARATMPHAIDADKVAVAVIAEDKESAVEAASYMIRNVLRANDASLA